MNNPDPVPLERVMNPTLPEKLLGIAQVYLDTTITTLASRSSDSLDFHEVSVWGIEAALRAAYELGVDEARQQAAEDAAGEDL